MEQIVPVTTSPRVHSSTTYLNTDDGQTYIQEWLICGGQPPEAVPQIYAYASLVDGEVDECAWHPNNTPPAVMACVVYPYPDPKRFH